jgi:hypothetical protein
MVKLFNYQDISIIVETEVTPSYVNSTVGQMLYLSDSHFTNSSNYLCADSVSHILCTYPLNLNFVQLPLEYEAQSTKCEGFSFVLTSTTVLII